jgi:hypothetical protein
MNEILAPFLWLCLSDKMAQQHDFQQMLNLPYRLFEAFLFRYLERHLCVDESTHTHTAFRLFHTLLLYHDPQLALTLQVCVLRTTGSI